MAKSKDNVIQIPFGKAGDPVQETSQFGRIAEGTYLATVFKIDPRETKDGTPMISIDLRVDSAPAKNKHISDVFVIQSGKGASMFAVQRLHGVLVASGIKQQSKTVGSDALIKNMEGRQLVIEVVDHVIPASDDYDERQTSKPSGYYRLDSEEADRVDGASVLTDDDEPEGDGDGSDAGDDGDDDEEDGDEEEKPRPKRKAKKSDDDGDGDFDDDGDDDDELE